MMTLAVMISILIASLMFLEIIVLCSPLIPESEVKQILTAKKNVVAFYNVFLQEENTMMALSKRK